MKFYQAAILSGGFVSMASPANAHLGHVGEVAGHGHIAGIAALGAAAAIAAVLAARKLRQKQKLKPKQKQTEEASS